MTWQDTLGEIRRVQTELLRLVPYRDAGLVPNPGAPPDAVERAERRVGRRLPPTYRAFLARHDGWPRFFDGAALLGTRELGKSSYADLAHAALDAAQVDIRSGAPPSVRIAGYPGQAIPFGIDPAGTTLFAFDPATADAEGEMGVVAWIQEIGIRRASFTDFLGMVLEFCEADLEALEHQPLRRIA
jgi:hypothetical protein